VAGAITASDHVGVGVSARPASEAPVKRQARSFTLSTSEKWHQL